MVGIGLTVILAYMSGAEEPPSAAKQAIVALLAILAQFGAVGVFSGEGKADPTLALRSVARLVNLATRANEAKRLAEAMQANDLPQDRLQKGAGQLSVHLSYLEEGYVNAVDDWRTFHPTAVELAEGRSVDDDG